MDIVYKKSSNNNNNFKKNKSPPSQVVSSKQKSTVMGFINLKNKNAIKKGNYPLNKALTPPKHNKKEQINFNFKENQIIHKTLKITKKYEIALIKNEYFTNTKHSCNGKELKNKKLFENKACQLNYSENGGAGNCIN